MVSPKLSVLVPVRRWWVVWLSFLILALLIAFALSSATVIPRSAATFTRMSDIQERVAVFASKHQRLPDSLSELSMGAGEACTIEDSWGEDIGYEVVNQVTVKLTSFGRDGMPGGIGEDADIIKKYSFPVLLKDDEILE